MNKKTTIADLYQISLPDGRGNKFQDFLGINRRLTTLQQPVNFVEMDDVEYTYYPALLSRDKLDVTINTQIDTMNIYCPMGENLYPGYTWGEAAEDNILIGGIIKLRKIFFYTDSDRPQQPTQKVVGIFKGYIKKVEKNPDKNEIKLKLDNEFARLAQPATNRVYQKTCTHRFASSDWDAQTGFAGESDFHLLKIAGHPEESGQKILNSVYYTNATTPEGWFTGGHIEINTGRLKGRKYYIIQDYRKFDDSRFYLRLSKPLPVSIEGEEIHIYVGCDKTAATCKSYGNLQNFFGFPAMPRKEVQL